MGKSWIPSCLWWRFSAYRLLGGQSEYRVEQPWRWWDSTWKLRRLAPKTKTIHFSRDTRFAIFAMHHPNLKRIRRESFRSNQKSGSYLLLTNLHRFRIRGREETGDAKKSAMVLDTAEVWANSWRAAYHLRGHGTASSSLRFMNYWSIGLPWNTAFTVLLISRFHHGLGPGLPPKQTISSRIQPSTTQKSLFQELWDLRFWTESREVKRSQNH